MKKRILIASLGLVILAGVLFALSRPVTTRPCHGKFTGDRCTTIYGFPGTCAQADTACDPTPDPDICDRRPEECRLNERFEFIHCPTQKVCEPGVLEEHISWILGGAAALLILGAGIVARARRSAHRDEPPTDG